MVRTPGRDAMAMLEGREKMMDAQRRRRRSTEADGGCFLSAVCDEVSIGSLMEGVEEGRGRL